MKFLKHLEESIVEYLMTPYCLKIELLQENLIILANNKKMKDILI
jgi:hypothetical protein